MENLYDYVFHYNHLKGVWSAIPRDKQNEYWNNIKCESILQSKDFNVLFELISRGEDFIKKVEKKD